MNRRTRLTPRRRPKLLDDASLGANMAPEAALSAAGSDRHEVCRL
jgi:hypothetical protein